MFYPADWIYDPNIVMRRILLVDRSCCWRTELFQGSCFERGVQAMQGVRGILSEDEGLRDRLVYEAIPGIVETLICDQRALLFHWKSQRQVVHLHPKSVLNQGGYRCHYCCYSDVRSQRRRHST
jgi:hypothetical protein